MNYYTGREVQEEYKGFEIYKATRQHTYQDTGRTITITSYCFDTPNEGTIRDTSMKYIKQQISVYINRQARLAK